jgi:hypothetical protein
MRDDMASVKQPQITHTVAIARARMWAKHQLSKRHADEYNELILEYMASHGYKPKSMRVLHWTTEDEK